MAQITAAESQAEDYTFSEPKVVLTAADNLYSIIEWLPDGQRVLMTENLISTRLAESDKMLQQSIKLYNPETGEAQVYATRYQIDGPPAWQAESNAVVYPAMNFLGRDKNTNHIEFTRQLWLSHGDPDAVQMIADNLSQYPLAVKPDGSQMAYLEDEQIARRNGLLEFISSAPFDPGHWDYSKIRNTLAVSYEMAWQAGTPLIFLYSEGGMQLGGGYTFILNADTGQTCELDLGGWAVQAHWSSDGRYLAAIRATISSRPVGLTDLVVLNTVTGTLFTSDVVPHDADSRHYVDDFAWAPDNHHLLAIGSVYSAGNTGLPDRAGMYLVDFGSGQIASLLPADKFYANLGENNLAWSPDGSKLLVLCPTAEDERLCYIAVETPRH